MGKGVGEGVVSPTWGEWAEVESAGKEKKRKKERKE